MSNKKDEVISVVPTLEQKIQANLNEAKKQMENIEAEIKKLNESSNQIKARTQQLIVLANQRAGEIKALEALQKDGD